MLGTVDKTWGWLAAPIERAERAALPIYRRMELPHTFKPQLSLVEAAIAAFAAFLRIFLGSLLFGVYGWNALVALDRMHSNWARAAAVPPMILVFLLLFALLMASISGLVRLALPKN